MSDATPSYPTRRRFVRIPSVVPVDYQFLTDAGAPVHPDVRTAFTRDLSEAVCACASRRSLNPPSGPWR